MPEPNLLETFTDSPCGSVSPCPSGEPFINLFKGVTYATPGLNVRKLPV
jgi:hypothetical protein